MVNLKSEKGAITLIVLVSCMFFIASVVCIQMYTQSKQTSVNREYKQIKSNYEKDIDNMDNIYNELMQIENTEVEFSDISIDRYEKNILVSVSVDTKNLNIETLKYGWLYSKDELTNYSSEDITEWTYIEKDNISNEIIASKKYTDDGYYYLCFMVDNKESWTKINDYIRDGLLIHYDSINNTKTGHSYNATIWEDLSGNNNHATLVGFENTSESGWLINGLKCNGENNYFKTADVNLDENSSLTVSITFTENKFAEYDPTNHIILKANDSTWKSFTLHTWYSDPTRKILDGVVFIGGNFSTGGGSDRFVAGELAGYKTREGKMDNLTYVYDKTTKEAKIYINSEQKASKTYTATPEAIKFFKTGVGNNKTYHDILIYNRALTYKEIKNNYDIDNKKYNIDANK